MKGLRLNGQLDSAAMHIQSVWRGYSTRKNLELVKSPPLHVVETIPLFQPLSAPEPVAADITYFALMTQTTHKE